MLSLRADQMQYEPYPIAYSARVFEPGLYARMQELWPDTNLFEFKPELGNKYSLSEINNGAHYRRFVAGVPVWRDLREHVKSREFLRSTLEFLAGNGVDLGVHVRKGWARRGAYPVRVAGIGNARMSARFEYSMMAGQGGYILPHTDSPNKMVTLVLSMLRDGEWHPQWGGGTDVVRPRDSKRLFNHVNKYAKFEDVDVIGTFPFVPNQCVTFVKTFNSWHCVQPLKGDAQAMRRTLTINLELVA